MRSKGPKHVGTVNQIILRRIGSLILWIQAKSPSTFEAHVNADPTEQSEPCCPWGGSFKHFE